MVDVSIIFVNYNTCRLTCESIKSVYNYTHKLNIEIIVSDNDSKDDSVSTIRNKFPEVIIIENKQNLGFGRGNNKGLEIAKGKYVLFLNTDTYLINNAVEILYDYMEHIENINVAVCGAKLFKADLSHNVSAGNFPNYKLFVKGSLWKHFYSKHFYSEVSRRPIPYESKIPFEVDYVSGADFFVRKQIIDKVGGFDKRFFMYAEDAELAYRIKQYFPKTKSMIVPEAKIVHISQGSQLKVKETFSFKYRKLKGNTKYFMITIGLKEGILYYITSVKRILMND